MGYVVLANRERPIILEPSGLGLRGITLRYAHEIRNEAECFAEIPNMHLPAPMLAIAEHIVDSKLADFDATYLEDRYRTVLVSMLREKQTMVPSRVASKVPSPKNVVDLTDMLQRSLAAARPPSSKTAKSRTLRAVAASSKADAAKRSKAGTRKLR